MWPEDTLPSGHTLHFAQPRYPLKVATLLEQRFSEGDESALREAYDAHSPLIYSFCRRALGDQRAEDVTQEVFVSAWRARDTFRPDKGNLGAWLVGIAKNRLIDNVRSEKRHSYQQPLTHEADASVEPNLDRVGDQMVVAEALRTLPERSRTVIELAYFSDLTHAEVAERTSIPLGTVKSDIRRGLAKIRQQLEATHG